MSIIDDPKPKRPAPPPAPKAKEPEGIDAEDVWEFWVGWMVRPYDGGWKLRRVRIPFHTLELYATDKATPANRREIVVAQIADEAGHPSLSTKTHWGKEIGHTPDPAEPEMVDMVEEYIINRVGMREARYRKVPKAAYLALAEEVRANHPLRTP